MTKTQKTRINIASFGGRTHLLDTARELDKQGYDVRFYSFVPDSRAEQFGLRKECNHSILWFAWPYVLWLRFIGFGGWGTLIYMTLCDWLMCIYMKPCDIMIGQSPMHYRSLKCAKKRWNAKTILERGSCHIVEFRKGVGGEYNRIFDKIVLHQDSKAYNVPDYISVGSDQAKKSFIINNIPEEKVFVNNYGFNSQSFQPTELSGDYDIIMVGTWSHAKGCEIIVEACKAKGYKCLHVGGIKDMDILADKYVTHIPHVDESKLVDYYRQAKVFVLPSKTEGLALVQCQAAACGLPIVCSRYTGGRDLKRYAEKPEYIIEMEENTPEALCLCIDKALELAEGQQGIRNYMGNGLNDVSFDAYGKRYAAFLKTII